MARYIVATHRAVVVRDWLCRGCEAYGQVAVDAKGHGRKRVWFSRDAATDVAHERAAADLQEDADHIVRLVRCPKCCARGPHASLAITLRALADVALGAFLGAVVGAIVDDVTSSMTLGVVAGVVILGAFGVVFGTLRRRLRAAATARLELGVEPAKPVSRPVGPPAPSQRPAAISGDPFRELPAPPPIAVERPAVQSAAPVVADDSADKPTFLT